jgi:phenylalanyl-tRNA synthetase beta chain
VKLSYNWLNDFIDLRDLPLEEVAERLTMSAFEVEEIEATGVNLDKKIVLGKIEKIIPHENADKLQVTQTSIGKETFQIVCGAKNIKEGQLVPVALVGAEVTDRKTGDKFKIKDSKIRGIESFGMLCSSEELGFDEDTIKSIVEEQGDGIYIIDAREEDIGKSISEVLGLKTDFVLEVGARSNRGDALSVLGQARELSAILKKNLKLPQEKDFDFKTGITDIEPKIDCDCDVFFTLAIKNIEIKESPSWLKDRITAMGISSINNIVDISNYVLLERGQPMHFYDKNKLSGNKLIVRKAKSGEKIVTLEEKEHTLDETNLVIADNNGPVSLAGVMGGLDSSINKDTKDLLIEVAVFSPSIVRKSSRSAGVESESKRRYERGVDKSQAKAALLKAVELIIELAGTDKTQIGEIKMAGSDKAQEKTVNLRMGQVEKILGIHIFIKDVISLLKPLGVLLKEETEEELIFSIPSFRQNDLTREIDLIEEIGRLYGFDKIPTEIPPAALFSSTKEVQNYTASSKDLRDSFYAYGYSEVKLSSLIGKSVAELDTTAQEFTSKQKLKTIDMDNPLSLEHSYMRRSLIPGLIQAASRNYSYEKNKDIKLFELGKIYGYSKDKVSTRDDCLEINKIAAILVKNERNWLNKKESSLAENFYSFKSVLDNLYKDAIFASFEITNQETHLIHPGISAKVSYQGKDIGIIAKLHPDIQKEWDLPDESYILELEFPRSNSVKFKPISNTPAILRDITVDSKLGLESYQLINLIKKNTPSTLKEIKVSGLFVREQGNLELENNKSTTLSMLWQDELETLKGEEIDSSIKEVKDLLEKELRVTFRA